MSIDIYEIQNIIAEYPFVILYRCDLLWPQTDYSTDATSKTKKEILG